jgi:hypothetical protein
MLFIFRFLYLFTFCQHEQLSAQFFKSYASLEVTDQREVATDLIFSTGFFLNCMPSIPRECLELFSTLLDYY